ncbi:fatty acyl-AMP ligase [Paraburkholderia gardini]|uniref:Long-chain-fatty-acid--AMP ligase FadD26 n=1 Tax=Paraburkholderia gardini TaxID=2823469 RepID=A0ABM8U3T0_9BURK|nr:fatty acyl-AMP ligase [Paraburkholderia gardini]CAG4899548.1 Long-chain-fatty-acid--AMP ligase FadD26 [Paraburkholderia gardini]CAG4910591.1 Long-chain-fatty-acid--AMP ligase FadD26 [Paraburkholderia gardini]
MTASNQPLQLLVPAAPYGSSSLVEVARGHAHANPAGQPFTYIDYSGSQPEDQSITCLRFDQRARQIAALLQTSGKPGDRVLLLYPAGLDYLCALFGCLYAGMIGVPAYPPLNPRLRDRLAAVARDCGASAALTTAATLTQLDDGAGPLARLRWFATDTDLAIGSLEDAWRDPHAGREQIAILQYTSGSTGTPKGVKVTHGNLLHNVYLIALHMQFRPDDRVLTWLPPYHDMGLIGSMLATFCAGVPVSFMAPAAFLRRPERWLSELSKRRCTISGAPNFAYELCVDKVTDEALGMLDLSSWELAYSGAEPVRADTLNRFAERFGPRGFRRGAFYPCYGMAETTLFVTGKRRDEPPRTLSIDSMAYANEARAIAQESTSLNTLVRELVSCGRPATGLDVRIVDPDTALERADGCVGEIWVAGPSVTAGYWERPSATAAVFDAPLHNRAGAYLKTGDLGFMRDGELYVSGRLKDLIIIRGVNHYPHDIERTVDQCHEAMRPGCGIAFCIAVGNEDHLVFAQEINRRDELRVDEIAACMRDAIYRHHGIQPYAIVLIANGSIPKTTSGKLSRRPCREQFLEDRLQVVAQWTNPRFVDTGTARDARHETPLPV